MRLNCKNIPLANIGAMDETPLQVEMPSGYIIDRKGVKVVSIKTRGKEKNRFTAIPTVMANGEKMKLMMIFNGLKKVPKGLKIPKNIHVEVAEKGSRTEV